jgi:6-phosphogluconolactonase (cycloisomerase 2 family)
MSLTDANLSSFSKPRAAAALVMLASFLTACGGGGSGGGTPPPPPPPPPQSYTIGGSVSGLTGSGLTLQDNGGNNLQVAAGASSFVFSAAVQTGGAYAVTVSTQPSSPAQTCTVTGGSGTVGASNITNVSVACTTAPVHVGGTISGLTGSGLVLQDNGGDNLQVSANATSFTFATPVAVGATFNVTVLTQPSSPPQTCTVSGGSGTVSASPVTSVVVACTAATFQVGGSISGLKGSGLVLQDNAGDNLTVAANATTFAFATSLASGAAYAVTVATQPTNPVQICTVANGSGTVAVSSISSVAVNCVSVGRFVYVVNSSDNGGAGDVAAFAINPNTGALTPVAGGPVPADGNPSGIVLDHTGQFAYVSNRSTGDVTFYDIDSTGALTFHQKFFSTQVAEQAIAISPSNQYVYVGGGAIASPGAAWGFGLNQTSGDLSPVPPAPPEPFPTADALSAVAVDPANQFLFAATGSSPSLYVFSVGTGGTLTQLANSPFHAARAGGVAVYPLGTAAGGYVYIADTANLQVSGFSYDGTGNLTQLTGSPYYTNGGTPTGITIDPAGTYLYVTNAEAGDSTITSFSINSQSGALTRVGAPVATGNLHSAPDGSGPIDVKVDPSNQYVYVVNGLDGSISQFTVSAGVLTLQNTYATGTGAVAAAAAVE